MFGQAKRFLDHFRIQNDLYLISVSRMLLGTRLTGLQCTHWRQNSFVSLQLIVVDATIPHQRTKGWWKKVSRAKVSSILLKLQHGRPRLAGSRGRNLTRVLNFYIWSLIISLLRGSNQKMLSNSGEKEEEPSSCLEWTFKVNSVT